MASNIYPKFKQGAMVANTGIDVTANTGQALKAALVTSSYTFSQLHNAVDDLTNVIQFASMTGATVSANGTLDAADVTWSSVAAGPAAAAIVIYKWNTTAADSHLVAFLDSSNVTGLPVTPNGGDITVTWDALGILSL